MPSKKPFLSFVVDRKLLEVIDAYRFEKRFGSRAAAIIDLIRLGLQAKGYAAPD